MQYQGLLDKLKNGYPPRCDKGNDHNQECIQSICTDVTCKLNFAPICHLCLEDRTHSSDDFHKYRHLKRCLKLLVDPNSDASGEQAEDQMTKFMKKITSNENRSQKQSELCIEMANSIDSYLAKHENDEVVNTNHDSVCAIVENIVKLSDLNDVRVQLSKLKNYCTIDNNGNPSVKIPDPSKSMKKAPIDYTVVIDIEANVFKIKEYIEECQSMINVYLLNKKGAPISKPSTAFSISRPSSRPSSNRRKKISVHQSDIQKSAPQEKQARSLSNNYTSNFGSSFTSKKQSNNSLKKQAVETPKTEMPTKADQALIQANKDLEDRIAKMKEEALKQFEEKQKLKQQLPRGRIVTGADNSLNNSLNNSLYNSQESFQPKQEVQKQQPILIQQQQTPVKIQPPVISRPIVVQPQVQPRVFPQPQVQKQPTLQEQPKSSSDNFNYFKGYLGKSPEREATQPPVQVQPRYQSQPPPQPQPVYQPPAKVQPAYQPPAQVQPPAQPQPQAPAANPFIRSAISNKDERKKHITYINYGANQVLALIDRKLKDGKYKFTINISKNKTLFVGIGIVNSLTMKGSKSNFEAELQQQFHGAYLLTSNKVYSSHDMEINGKFNRFLKFGNNDKISCVYNTVEKKLTFEVDGNNKPFELEFQSTGSEVYYPCMIKQADNVCKIQDDYDPDWLYL